MLFEVKTDVNLFTLVDELITRLNNTAKTNNIPKVYEVRVKDGTYKSNVILKENKKPKPFKTIVFTSSDLETREQIVLFSADYVLSNPADALKVNYKKILYKELLFSCLLFCGISFENSIKEERIKQAVNLSKKVENGQES